MDNQKVSGRALRVLNLSAFAKINLVLDLLGPRPDGFTEIATVFQTVELADRVGLEWDPDAGTETALEVIGDLDCSIEKNLAFLAARMFREQTPFPGALRIRLEKQIPAGAGLGGGSSDAAAVLWGLAGFMGKSPGIEGRLVSMAARLGSDVPFFLDPGLALGRGRGEVLERLPDLPSWPVVLVYPGAGLSTAEVYARARSRLTARETPPNILRFLRYLEGPHHGFPPLSNDLFQAAAELRPEIARLVKRMEQLGGRAAMTGSGSAVFGLFPGPAEAGEAAAELTKEQPGYWVRPTRTLPRREARAAREE